MHPRHPTQTSTIESRCRMDILHQNEGINQGSGRPEIQETET